MNIQKVKLSKIFIGEIDGESEVIKRSDFENLFFNQNNNYEKLISGDKFLIKGRKGTGKTYLAKYLNIKINASSNQLCKICDSSSFNLQRLIDIKGRDLLKGEYEFFWEWIILLHFSDAILEQHPFRARIPFTQINKLYKFKKTKYPNPESVFEKTSYSQTTNESCNLSTNQKEIPISASINSSNSYNSSYLPKEYYKNLNYLHKLVVNILSTQSNITLIYDDLDSIEANTHIDTFYIDLLSGFIKCVKKLNLEIAKGSTNSKLIIALRDAILSYMQDYNTNLNKLTSSHFIDLYWLDKVNPNEPYKHPLMDLILSKIKKSTPSYSRLTNKKLYGILFPKKIRDKDAIYYLLDHSFGRPRDIIKFLNIIQNKHGSAVEFKPKYFFDCMKEYSNWFYDELRNEISIHSNSNFLKESLELIKNIRKINFKLDDAVNVYNKSPQSYPNILNVSDSITSMYKLGVIGNSWSIIGNNNIQKYHHSWSYRCDADSEPDFSKTFVVHSALRKRFSLY
ncbi:hypothetical protein VOI05_001781 [Clostridium perfringens]